VTFITQFSFQHIFRRTQIKLFRYDRLDVCFYVHITLSFFTRAGKVSRRDKS